MSNLTTKAKSLSSSGTSTTSSTVDMKTSKRDHKLSTTRSRSFLHCISKHLGRHFLLTHHHNREGIYNSQDDIRSSSTDSFSLSFERGSHVECHIASSSIDLTSGEEQTSRTSSASAYSRFSPAFCQLDVDDIDSFNYNPRHIYVETMYRPASSLGHTDELSSDDEDNNGIKSIKINKPKCRKMVHLADTEDDEDENVNGGDDENEEDNGDADNEATEQNTTATAATTPTNTTSSTGDSSTSRSTSSASKGLHLSRISISSSVSRMFHHFSSSASTRSLSCSSTPLRRLKDTVKSSKSKVNNSKKSNQDGNQKHSSTSSGSTTSGPSSSNKKKEKKQQSILRPPIHYVYMKGMSGLYSRVPRYTVCCPYAMQQFA